MCKFHVQPLTVQKKKGIKTAQSVNEYSVTLDQAIVHGTQSIEGIRPYPISPVLDSQLKALVVNC